MSLVNAIIRPELGLVVVDTQCKYPVGGAEAHVAKMIANPVGRYVLAGRGDLSAIWTCAAEIGAGGAAFDDLEGGLLLNQLRSAWHAASAMYARLGLPENAPTIAGLEVLSVGWSARERAVIGLYVGRDLATGAWSQKTMRDSIHVAPWFPSWGEPPGLTSAQELRRCAGHQVGLHRRMLPDAAIGGRLIEARITKSSIRLEDAGPVVLPDEPAKPRAPEAAPRNAFAAVATSPGWAA